MPKFNQRKNMDTKLILIVRNDLKMGKGKIAAQVGHAVLGIYKNNIKQKRTDILEKWFNTGEAKVVCKINSERDLYTIKYKAEQMNICTCVIQDAGRTQIAAGSSTVLAIGPDYSNRLNQITSHLKLL